MGGWGAYDNDNDRACDQLRSFLEFIKAQEGTEGIEALNSPEAQELVSDFYDEISFGESWTCPKCLEDKCTSCQYYLAEECVGTCLKIAEHYYSSVTDLLAGTISSQSVCYNKLPSIFSELVISDIIKMINIMQSSIRSMIPYMRGCKSEAETEKDWYYLERLTALQHELYFFTSGRQGKVPDVVATNPFKSVQ